MLNTQYIYIYVLICWMCLRTRTSKSAAVCVYVHIRIVKDVEPTGSLLYVCRRVEHAIHAPCLSVCVCVSVSLWCSCAGKFLLSQVELNVAHTHTRALSLFVFSRLKQWHQSCWPDATKLCCGMLRPWEAWLSQVCTSTVLIPVNIIAAHGSWWLV